MAILETTIIASIGGALVSGIATAISIVRSKRHHQQKENIKDVKIRVNELQAEIDKEHLSPDRVSELIQIISSDLKKVQDKSIEVTPSQSKQKT